MTPQYLVSVCGSNAPTKTHTTLDSARAEAQRLAGLPQNRDRIIHVVEIKATLRPVFSHAWQEAQA